MLGVPNTDGETLFFQPFAIPAIWLGYFNSKFHNRLGHVSFRKGYNKTARYWDKGIYVDRCVMVYRMQVKKYSHVSSQLHMELVRRYLSIIKGLIPGANPFGHPSILIFSPFTITTPVPFRFFTHSWLTSSFPSLPSAPFLYVCVCVFVFAIITNGAFSFYMLHVKQLHVFLLTTCLMVHI